MHTLNLGIVAHVDAGKTSLTERLLFAAGVLDKVGSVDAGSTQTDSLALERARGITIRSAVVSFVLDGVTVNLLDTPGHPDFIAEVDRVLGVLDAAVLVVSAVEGVQPQTRVLMRALQRLHIPAVVFVNKIDRGGAADERVLDRIVERLTPAIVAMGSVDGLGSRGAEFRPYGPADADFVAKLRELLADGDDTLLADYVEDEATLSYARLSTALAAQTRQGRVSPVFFGSAITGAGVEALLAGLTRLLPSPDRLPDGELSGTVFKVDRGPAGDKIAYVRVFAGSLHVRDRVAVRGHEHTITAIRVFDRGAAVPAASVGPGRIARLWGLDSVRVGDPIGVGRRTADADSPFPPPSLETVVRPVHPGDAARMHTALTQLAEQDPLIALRRDDVRDEVSVSLYGEVQKEVIEATLADDFGVPVTFRPTTTICIERPIGSGAAVEFIGVDPNPFLATVGLRVDPAAAGAGVQFRLGVELGSMPYAFMRAIEETVDVTLAQGLYGWAVTDCTVTLTHSGYWARQSHAHGSFDKSMSSTAGDFRALTPLVLMSALRRSGSAVLEPVHRFTLEFPAAVYGALVPVLTRLRAVPGQPAVHGALCLVDGTVPASGVHELRQRLPSLTGGKGVLESAFDRYQPAPGPTPTRPRTDANPLDRRAYLLRVQRRVR